MADIDDEIRSSLQRLGTAPPSDGVLGRVSGRRDRLVRRRRAATVVATVAAVAVLGGAIAVAASPRSPEGVVVDSPTTPSASSTTSTSTTSTTTTTAPTTTTVPSMTVERVRSAVLDPATCEWVLGTTDVPRPLTLADGRLVGLDEQQGFVALYGDPVLADVDGDGAEDAIFVVQCNAGGSGSTFEVQASSGSGAQLGHFAVGEDRSSIQDLSFDGTTLTVTYTLHEADEALCCGGSRLATDQLRWEAGRWVVVDQQVVDAGSVGRSIVDAANRGELAALGDLLPPEAVSELEDMRGDGPITGCDHTFGTDVPLLDRPVDAGARECLIKDATGFSWGLVLEPTGPGTWRVAAVIGIGGGM